MFVTSTLFGVDQQDSEEAHSGSFHGPEHGTIYKQGPIVLHWLPAPHQENWNEFPLEFQSSLF